MPMSEKINLCQVQGPCRAGTQRLAAQRRTRRDRAAGRPRPLPPARHCSPGKPRPHTGHLLFLQQGAFGGKYVPAGLGHFPLRGPWPRLWPGSRSGRAGTVRAKPGPRHGLALVGGWIWEGGFGKATLEWLHRHQVELGGSWGQPGDILEVTAPRREGWGGSGFQQQGGGALGRDRPQICRPEQGCPGQGSSTAPCPRWAQALAHPSPKLRLLVWRPPCPISFPHGRGAAGAHGSAPPAAGRRMLWLLAGA